MQRPQSARPWPRKPETSRPAAEARTARTNNRQAGQFSFQARAGPGFYFDWNGGSKNFLSVTWKRFPNADHLHDNNGFDLPGMITPGARS